MIKAFNTPGYIITLSLIIAGLQSCSPSNPDIVLPIPGGITLVIHESGGDSALNDSIQISDHWQLSSVGRSHGWMRKLEVEEQKELVRLLHNYSMLESVSEGKTRFSIFARGTGEGYGTSKDAEELNELVNKFIGSKRVAFR